jgi:hypothetical protein
MEKVQNLRSSNTAPSSKTFRDEMNNITTDSDLVKQELVRVKKCSPSPVYSIEKLLQNDGSTPFRLPSYHRDLNLNLFGTW